MCGIIGYIGKDQAAPILLEGLKRLEYRGYDSSGIGVIDPETRQIVVRKIDGKIKNLEKLIDQKPFPQSSIGISHTRWATHGAPNEVNAHPHFDMNQRILVVHNGIIENYETLKKDLQKKGYKFKSQTDTEVVAHLISYHYKKDLKSAFLKAIKSLKGAFALGVIAMDQPDLLLAARIGSPLIIGLGKDGNFIASDVPAILDHTKKIVYLKEGQFATITKDKVETFDFTGKKVAHKIDQVSFKIDDVQKQGFDHFMLKEIYEQPSVIKKMLNDRIKNDQVTLDGLGLTQKQIKSVSRIAIVACGTAFHAGLIGKYIIEELAGVSVQVDVSSEFRYRNPIVDKKTLVIAVSQSGETADTLAAIREAKAKGALVVSICNVLGSSLTRESDGVLYTHAGPEIGVASTKAYTTQLCMFYLLALNLAQVLKAKSKKELQNFIKDLKKVPALYTKMLKDIKETERIARANSHFGCFLFLGRHVNFPMALEGALKLKEISYIPAEGYAAGEMKHGPIALIDEYRAVVCIAVQSDTYEKVISNIEEIKSRRGKVIAIATTGDKTISERAANVLYVPKIHQLITPLLVAIPLQLFAYYVAVQRGCDVDQPRNLAKSVTVE